MSEKDGMSNCLKFVDDIGKQKPVRGILNYKVFKDGVLIEEVKGRNLILNGARVQMAHLVAGDFSGRNITKIAIGVNGTPPTVTDVTLNGTFMKSIDSYSFPAMGQVQFDWSLGTTEANGMAILEFGLMSDDETLFSRRIREDENGDPVNKPINKESDISIIGQWIIIF
jgi:hypothetical protein